MDFTTLAWIDSTGYHFADFPTFQQAVYASYQNIYGLDTVIDPATMDGQFLTILAQAFYDVAALGASVYNSFSPVTAQGVGLARLVKINGITKEVATNSTAILTVVGSAGTVINNGIAIDSLQQQWILPASVTIPGGGTINVTATALEAGAVLAEPNTINTIFTPTLGWQTVNNASSAVAGNPVEQDGQLRVRQQNSVGLPALTVLDATYAALSNLSGVTQVAAYENDTDSTDGNGLTPHSVCFIVDGGADLQSIANVMGLYKTPGTKTFASGPNAQTETYTDPKGLPVTINFISPAVTATINVELSVTPGVGWSSDFVADIQQAISDAVQAVPIGKTVVLTELYLPAYLAGTDAQGAYVVSGLEIEYNGGGFATADINLAFDEVPVCPVANVNVTVV